MTLQFKSFDPTIMVTWRFQGQVMFISSKSYVISSLSQENAGIYECYQSKGPDSPDSSYRYATYLRNFLVQTAQTGIK